MDASLEGCNHDSPPCSQFNIHFTFTFGCSDTTDRAICCLQFVEGFMDSLPCTSALETPNDLSTSIVYILKPSLPKIQLIC